MMISIRWEMTNYRIIPSLQDSFQLLKVEEVCECVCMYMCVVCVCVCEREHECVFRITTATTRTSTTY